MFHMAVLPPARRGCPGQDLLAAVQLHDTELAPGDQLAQVPHPAHARERDSRGGGEDRAAEQREPGDDVPAEDLTCRPRAGDRRAQGRVRSGSADQGRVRPAGRPGIRATDLRGTGRTAAVIPGWVTSAQPSAEHARKPGRVLSFKTAARVGALGASLSIASAAVVMMQSSGVPAVAGVLLVGVTGLFVAGLLAALLMFLSWVVRRSQGGPAQGPPSGAAGLAAERQAPARRLPSARHDPWHMAEAARSRLPRVRVSPVQARGDVLAVDSS